MMSQRSKHELAQELQARYLKATRLQKTQILNEFVANTGYHRKHAIRLLKRGRFQRAGKRRGRRPQYRGEVVISLQAIWEISGRICSLRLRPFPVSDGLGAAAFNAPAPAAARRVTRNK